MPFPIPGLDPGDILITFEANLPGYDPTTATVPAAMATKMLQYCNDRVQRNPATGEWEPVYDGLTTLFMRRFDADLGNELRTLYPDGVDEIAAKRAELEALIAASQIPTFKE